MSRLASWFRRHILMETPGIDGPRFVRPHVQLALRASRFDASRHRVQIQMYDRRTEAPCYCSTEDGKLFTFHLVWSDFTLPQQTSIAVYEFSQHLKAYEGEEPVK